MEKSPEYLTLEEACKVTDPPTPIGTMRFWISTGKLKAFKPGRLVLVSRDALRAFIESAVK